MKLTFSVFVLMGLFGVSNASPHPNNGGTVTVSVSGIPVTTPSAIVSFSVSRVPYPPGGWGGGGTISYAYPSPVPAVCYSAVPYPPPVSVSGGITTRFPTPGATFTGPWSSFATPSTVPTSVAHENWGKPTYTITSVYATAPAGHPVCPPGYTSSINGVGLPGGTQGASGAAPSATFTSISNAAPSSDPSTTPNAQNLNADDKPTGVAAPSFKLSFAATLVGSIAAASLMI